MGTNSYVKPMTEKSTCEKRFPESRGWWNRGRRNRSEWAQEGDPIKSGNGRG